MTMFKRMFALDDDGGGGAATDAVDNPAPVTPQAPAAPAITAEQIRAIADGVRAGMTGVTVTTAAPAPVVDEAARTKAAYDKINEVAATGDVAGAMDLMVRHMSEQSSRGPRPDVTQDPAFIGVAKQARKLAAVEHKEAFDKYGAEIDAAIANLPPAQRLDPDTYTRVVRDVRANHIDDILAAEREKWMAEQNAARNPLPPQAGGSRGARRDTSVESVMRNLTDDQRGIAASLGVPLERYAAQVLEIGDRDRGLELAPFDSPTGVTPGRF